VHDLGEQSRRNDRAALTLGVGRRFTRMVSSRSEPTNSTPLSLGETRSPDNTGNAPVRDRDRPLRDRDGVGEGVPFAAELHREPPSLHMQEIIE